MRIGFTSTSFRQIKSVSEIVKKGRGNQYSDLTNANSCIANKNVLYCLSKDREKYYKEK